MSGKYILIRHETLSVRHGSRKMRSPVLLHAGRKVYKDKEPDLYQILMENVPKEYHGSLDEAAKDRSIRLILGEDSKATVPSEMSRAEKVAAQEEAKDLLPGATNQELPKKAKAKTKSGE